ncbi:MAG: hypothetical protein QW350_04900 [Candidatus Aenigmatarchaeota archaeon]
MENLNTVPKVASQLDNIGFPEFTANLINSVYDALLSGTLKQMEAYQELLSSVSKTLEEFQEANYSEVTIAEAQDWLVQNFPVTYTDSNGQEHKVSKIGAVLVDGVMEIGKLNEDDLPNSLTYNDIADANDTALEKLKNLLGNDLAGDFTESTTYDELITAIRKKIAGNRYTILKEMVKLGIMRLFVKEAEIETKLTFSVSVTEMQGQNNYTYTNSSFSAGISGGGVIKKVFNISGNLSYSKVNVRTSSSWARTLGTASADIMGRVLVKLQSDFIQLSNQ